MSAIQPTKTIVYKTVGELEIPLDLYLPENAKNVPILLWFHGGGLLQGRRDALAPFMRRGVSKHGFACVSADYRLAPQARVWEILDDVRDCVAFIRSGALAAAVAGLGADALDTSRLAVSGSSAGGYLTLLAGLYVEPKPRVILPIYPITDPLGSFFRVPQPAPMGRTLVPREELAKERDPASEAVANCGPAPGDVRGNMYVRMLADADLAALWGVQDGREGERWRLSRQVYERGLPPAYFLHGDSDTCVGVEQGDEVVGAMLGCGIEVVYERPHGLDHFLDNGEDYENEAFYAFMLKHLK